MTSKEKKQKRNAKAVAHITKIDEDLIKIFYVDGHTEKRTPTKEELCLLDYIEWLAETPNGDAGVKDSDIIIEIPHKSSIDGE